MKSSAMFKTAPALFAGCALLAGLYTISLYNYLLFHALIELFSVVTAFVIFALAWHTRTSQDKHYWLFIGVALLFAGVLDLLHFISYKGMGILHPDGGNLATQFWIAFRFVFSLSFLASILFLRAKLNIGSIIALYVAVDATLIVSILLGWFPACYVDGMGLTRFKIVSEYIICLIFLSTLVLLVQKKRDFDPGVLRLMVLSLLFSIASEFSFTEYASVSGFSNMLGHLFLFASVASIYRAIVVTAVVEPSRLLYRDLKLREEAITASEKKYRLLFENMMNALAYHRIVCDEQGRPVDYLFLEVNSAFEAVTGLKAADIIGKGVREVLPGIENDPADWIGVYGNVAMTGQPVRMEQRAAGFGKWFSVSAYSPAPDHCVAVFEDITERKQADEALQQSMRRFELLSGTAGDLLQSTQPQRVIDSICRKVMEQLACDVFFNYLMDDAAGKLHLNSSAGVAAAEAQRIEWLDLGVAVCGSAARDGCRIVAEHIPTTPDPRTDLVRSYGIRAYACHPILGPAGKVLGTLSFGTRSRETFSEDDLSLMKAVTDQVAVAMVRMRVEQALRRAHDELELRVRDRTAALAEANEQLEQEIMVRRLAEKELRASEERFRKSVENLLDGFAILSAVRNASGRIVDFRYEYVNEAGCRLNFRTREEQVGHTLLELLPALRDSDPFNEYVRVVETGEPMARTQMLFEDVFGGRRLNRAFDLQAVKLGDGFAVVWRDVSEVREAARRIGLTNELLKLFTKKVSLKEYLDVAAELIRDWSGCNHVGIRMLRDDGRIPYVSSVEFSPLFLQSENMLSIAHDECACIRVIAERPEAQDSIAMSPHGSFSTNDFPSFVAGLNDAEKKRFRGVCVQSGYQSVAVVPIRYRENVFGAIHLADERKEMVPFRNIVLFEHLALILGEAIFRFRVEEDLMRQREELVRMNEQLRNLSAHVDAVRESERTNIAREIHDELGQVLTAVKMDVSWLRNRLPASEANLAHKAVETLQLIDGAIQSVKRISAELRPGVLDDIGLAAAVEWAAKEFQKRTGIACTVTVNPETLIVDRMRSTALFRILQESLTNIMRHAEASHVAVSLTEKDDATVLSVADNGKGIPEGELASPHAFGLIGMRERVQFLHGTIRIEGVPNAGTTVTVTLPIHSGKEQTDRAGHAGWKRQPAGTDGPGRYAEAEEQ